MWQDCAEEAGSLRPARVKEYLNGLGEYAVLLPWGYRNRCRIGALSLQLVSIIGKENDVVVRKAWEALRIATECPQVRGKEGRVWRQPKNWHPSWNSVRFGKHGLIHSVLSSASLRAGAHLLMSTSICGCLVLIFGIHL